MSLGSLLLWILTGAAGAAVMGAVRLPLRLDERVALAAVVGVIATTLATLLLALFTGLSETVALVAPVLVIAGAVTAGPGMGRGRLVEPWRESWHESTTGEGRAQLFGTWAIALLALVSFGLLFAHTLFTSDGAIKAGYATVWADWSLHSTLASSFVHGSNLPPHDPIFSGAVLRYPFLGDFHSAVLQEAGMSLTASLAFPGVVLCTAITMLVVALGRRLTGSLAVGLMAIILCVVGGGLGFTGVWWDACRAAGVSDCTVRGTIQPGTALDVARHIPDVVRHMDDPSTGRAYDNLQNSDTHQLGNIQWYTPLLAWWLPQRSFVYGFAAAVAVLLLVVAAMRAPPGTRSPFILAGLLAGALPFVHVHSLIALAIALPLMALSSRRREWLWLGGTAVLLAVPRLIQLAAGGHGVTGACTGGSTAFPYLEPGWKWNTNPGNACLDPGHFDASIGGVIHAIPRTLQVIVDPGFWGFWLLNNGVVVIVALVVALAAALRYAPQGWALIAGRPRDGVPVPGARAASGLARLSASLLRPVSGDLLRFTLPLLAIFAISNVVVFQTWDWDNTKLLAYWYLGGALLTAAWVRHWWQAGLGRALIACAAMATLLLSGGLNLGRIVEAERSTPGLPYTWASATDIAFAAKVRARTAPTAVFLTHGDPTDPVLTLAGRTAVMGYQGWLYSYGDDLGTRPQDTAEVYGGCVGGGEACIPEVLARYHVDYVEIRQNDVTAPWFGQAYPLVAKSADGVSIYDVRRS